MQRRTLFNLGFASAALLALAGGTAALLRPGWNGNALSATGREVFTAVGKAVLDKTLPEPDAARQSALTGLLERIDVLVRALPSQKQAELSQLLSLLASAPGRHAVAGLGSPWPTATVPQVQAALQAMRLSKLALRQQAYGALHDIAASAYFADPANWVVLGYPGPLKI